MGYELKMRFVRFGRLNKRQDYILTHIICA